MSSDPVTLPLQVVCDLITDGSHFSPTPQEDGYPIVNAKDIPSGRINLGSCTRISPADWETLKMQNCAPRVGDVLLSKDGTIGRVALCESDLGVVVLSSIAILRPNNAIDPGYLAQALRSDAFRRQLLVLESGSALRRIVLRDIRSLEFSFPQQKSEQTKIADILSTVDRAIEQTDALITKQQRIKTGLMQDLLTRGIDEHGNLRSEQTHAFKDSPLGRMPVEWQTKTVGEVFQVQLGKMLNQKASEGHSPFPYLGNKNVQWDYVETAELQAMDFNERERHKFGLKFGDILVCEGGEVGRTCLWRDEVEHCYYQKAVHRLRPISAGYLPDLFPRFMRWGIAKGLLTDFTSRTSIAHLTQEKFATVPLSVPDPGEQLRINDVLDVYDDTCRIQSARLAKLRLLKTALMQDLFTGKKRVTPLLEPML